MTQTSRFHICSCGLAAAAVVLGVGVALAVQPGRWSHTTEADFTAGKSENTVVSNLGEIKLAAGNRTVGSLPEGPTIITDLQQLKDGSLYLAGGPEGRLMVRKDDKFETVATLAGEQIFSLSVLDDGRLLVAVSGAKSRLATLEGTELKILVELPGVRYIWDVLVSGKRLYAATGTEGKVFSFEAGADGVWASTLVLDAAQTNVLCLARDDAGNLYAGTDTDGLIYKISQGPDGKPSPFVLYDAGEPEIGALLVRANGTVFAGTADANQARATRGGRQNDSEGGRPDTQPSTRGGRATTRPSGAGPAPGPGPGSVPPRGGGEAAPVPAQPAPAPPAPAEVPAPAAAAPDAEPTQQQFDELRQVIRNRLEAAARNGSVAPQAAAPGPGSAAGPNRQPPPTAPPSARGGGRGAPAREGNAIYRIDTNGFVNEVFRDTVTVQRIIEDPSGPGRLLVATGEQGQLFRVDPIGEETTILLDLESLQIPAMQAVSGANAGDPGYVLLGTANPASVLRLDDGFSSTGTYTSVALDATQVSHWGKLNLTADIPTGTAVSVETRSGNVGDPEKAPWSEWSVAGSFTPADAISPLQPVIATVQSPPARFLQYRLKLTGDGKLSSVVQRVDIAYVMPNLRPSITAIRATYPNLPGSGGPAPRGGGRGAAAGGGGGAANEPQPATTLSVEWEANDPNNDALRYKLEYQPAGSARWLLVAENIEQTSYDWQTRRIPDGRYRLRVTASDATDNPADMAQTNARTSDPVVIDNTPPAVKTTLTQNGADVAIAAQVEDVLTSIREVKYALDAKPEWNAMLPDAPDLIYDSTKESVTIKITALAPGPHVVTIRATDAQGNSRYEAVQVEVNR